MFWGLSCESGKRYSQIPKETFHISMAALEPRDKLPKNLNVSLMLEQEGKEYLLCTLDYSKALQVNLDLEFDKGEELLLFINGEGTVHLSGYSIIENDNEDDVTNDVSKTSLCELPDESLEVSNEMEDEEETSEEEEEADLPEYGTNRLLYVDMSSDEEGIDYQPPDQSTEEYVMYKAYNLRTNQGEGDSSDDDDDDFNDEEQEGEEVEDESDEEEDDDDWEEDDDDIEEETVENGKRKKLEMPGPSGKRMKNDTFNIQCKTKAKASENFKVMDLSTTPKANGEVEPQASTSKAFQKLSKKEKKQAKLNQNEEKTVSAIKTEQKFTKLPCGTEIEDMRIGNGPVAKSGRFLHVFYTGTLLDGTSFDSVNRGSKPFGFRLGRSEVIKGWDTGIEGMRVGGKRQLKIPPNLAYGKKGHGPIPPNSSLVFTIELESVR